MERCLSRAAYYSRMCRQSFFIVVIMVALIGPSTAFAQDSKIDSVPNGNLVRILTGSVLSSSAHLADELRSLSLLKDDIRVSPVIGDGDIANLSDIVTEDSIDLTIVQLDVLNYFLSADIVPDLAEKLKYITSGHMAEFHLLAKNELLDIEQLEGKRVNIGPRAQGTYFSASELFVELDVEIEPTSFPHLKAYSELTAGTIDAMVLVDGKPSKFLQLASLDDGVRLISIPRSNLSDDYLEGMLGSDDYPQLLAGGDSIRTVAVPMVLLAYNWPEGSDARNRLNKFISFFVANLPSLRSHEQAFHPKWREFDIWNSLPSTLRRDRFVIDRVNPMRKLNEEGSASN